MCECTRLWFHWVFTPNRHSVWIWFSILAMYMYIIYINFIDLFLILWILLVAVSRVNVCQRYFHSQMECLDLNAEELSFKYKETSDWVWERSRCTRGFDCIPRVDWLKTVLACQMGVQSVAECCHLCFAKSEWGNKAHQFDIKRHYCMTWHLKTCFPQALFVWIWIILCDVKM